MHVNDGSTDDDFQSLDSLENTSPKYKKQQIARKLDESEVLIVSPAFIVEDGHEENEDYVNDELIIHNNNNNNNNKLLDTSHVSVVTVGEEEVKVKDSSHHHLIGNHNHHDSISDLSNVSCGPSESSDDVRIDVKPATPILAAQNLPKKMNGEFTKSREDVSIIVNKKKIDKQRISPDSSVGSMEGGGSVRSTNTPIPAKIDRSDAESIATTASHDSRDPGGEEEVQLRHKPREEEDKVPPVIAKIEPAKKPPQRSFTKEEIHLNNLRKKTRKRTRKFEIDGVQVTTTTSKVIYSDEDSNKLYDEHLFRKQELRELKMLQKAEKKQFYDLQAKEMVAKEQQEKKFEQERIALERTYEADMDVLARQHRQTVEKYEQQQETELRNTSKKIRAEQERDLKLV